MLHTSLCYINTVKPVWNYPLWKDHPVQKDHLPVCERFYLPLDSTHTEPVWNNHLCGKITFSWHLGSFWTGFTLHSYYFVEDFDKIQQTVSKDVMFAMCQALSTCCLVCILVLLTASAQQRYPVETKMFFNSKTSWKILHFLPHIIVTWKWVTSEMF